MVDTMKAGREVSSGLASVRTLKGVTGLDREPIVS